MKRLSRLILSAAFAALLAACGGDDDDAPAGGPAAPTITAAPAAASVAAGATATFSVTAAGTGPLSYQWQLNGADIAGATGATYTTAATNVADSGNTYSVKVTNAAGTVTSGAVALTVTTAGGPTVAATQESADQLVAAVNSGVDSIRQSDAAGLLPGGARIVSLPAGATFSGTYECSLLGGDGSGNVTYSTTLDDATGFPVSANYSYNNCNFGAAGYSYSMNGSGSMTYSNYVDALNYTWTLSYNITYSYTAGGYSDAGTINSTETCVFSAGDAQCSFLVGDSQVSNVSITTSGSVTTVADARLQDAYLDCDYNGWVYDSSTGRATAGAVVVSDGQGNSATITATGTGYTVVITLAGGGGGTFTVAYG